jgi:peptide/nickel transport system substrate-binding protein
LLAIGAAACAGGGAGDGAASDGRLVVAVSSLGNETVIPSADSLTAIGTDGAPIYDWLVWPDKDGTAGPGIATEWKEGVDHLSWTITLRDDQTFSDGSTVTADDVAFSIGLHLDPEATSSYAGLWQAKVKKVEVVSPTELVIRLTQPWPNLPDALSPYEGAQGAVLSRAAYEKLGADGFAQAPVGSGPWTMVKHAAGQYFDYERSDAASYRDAPGYESMRIQLMPDDGSRLSALQAGEVDLAEITPAQAKQAQDAGLQVLETPDFADAALTFFGDGDPRAKSMPTSDPRVREALSLAIDRDQLIDSVLFGYGKVPARFIVGEGTLGADPRWKADARDLERAKTLLADAGYADGGFTVTVFSAPVAGAPWIPRATEAIAGYWDELGVDTKIVPTDYGTMSTKYRERPLADDLVGAAMVNIAQVTNSNITLLGAYYGSASVVFVSPTSETDKLVAAAQKAMTYDELGPAITALVDHVHDQWTTFPLVRSPSLYAATKDVDGWDPYRSAWLGMMLDDLHPRG